MTEAVPAETLSALRRNSHKMAAAMFVSSFITACLPRTGCERYDAFVFHGIIFDVCVTSAVWGVYNNIVSNEDMQDRRWVLPISVWYYGAIAACADNIWTRSAQCADLDQFVGIRLWFWARFLALLIYHVFFTKPIEINKQHSS